MTAADAAPVLLPPAGTYAVDPARSTVAFSGRHLFGLSGVTADFTVASGRLVLTEPVTASSVTLTIDAASFRSDKQRRDTHVASRALLDSATYPEITFVSDGVREEDGGWLLTGSVTAHGTSVPAEVHVTALTHDSDGVRVHARTERLDRYAFGVSGVKGMAGRYLDLDFDLLAVPV